jgi:hypothetical protein
MSNGRSNRIADVEYLHKESKFIRPIFPPDPRLRELQFFESERLKRIGLLPEGDVWTEEQDRLWSRHMEALSLGFWLGRGVDYSKILADRDG